MKSQEAVLFPVSLSLSISPQEADASAALTLEAVAKCPEDYDLSGDPVSFFDAAAMKSAERRSSPSRETTSARRSP